MELYLPDGDGNVGFERNWGMADFRIQLKTRHDKFKAHRMQRRRLMGSILFLEQTRDTIHLIQQALLTNVNSQRPPVEVVMPIVYEAWMEKRGGVWKIKKWIDACDTVGDGGTEPKELNDVSSGGGKA